MASMPGGGGAVSKPRAALRSARCKPGELGAKSLHIELRFCSKHLSGHMTFSEKSLQLFGLML